MNKAILVVPGCPFTLLLSRSQDFKQYHTLLKLQFLNERDIRVSLTAMQLLLDPTESGGWISSIYYGMPASSPSKQAFMIPALGDAQVTTIGAHILARAFRFLPNF